MADTDIVLGIDLDVKDAKREARDLQKAVEEIFESRKDNESASIVNLELQMKKTYDIADDLKYKLDELGQGDSVPTEKYKELTQTIEDVGVELEKLLNKREQLEEQGMLHPADKRYKELNDQIEIIGNRYDELINQQKQMEDSGMAFVPVNTTEAYKKLEGQLDAVNDKLKQQIIRYDELQQKQRNVGGDVTDEFKNANQSITALSSSLRGITRLIPGLSSRGIMAVSMLTRGVNKLTKLTAKDLVNAIGYVTKAFGKLIVTIIKNPILVAIGALIAGIVFLVKKLKEAYEQIKELIDKIAEGLKSSFKYLVKAVPKFLYQITTGLMKINKLIFGTLLKGIKLIFSQVFLKGIISGVKTLIASVKSLTGIVRENLDLLAKWNHGNNEVNTSLSNITSSLAYLKASITSAFVPILKQVEPILTSIIDKLAEATTAIGMFIAKLTGASSFQKAIRRQKDYAKSLEDTNNQLAAFDKLNVISQKEDESVGFEMVDMEEIDLQAQSIVDWFNSLEKAGKDTAQTVTNFLKSIPWNDITEGAKNASLAVSNFINGFMSNPEVGIDLGSFFGNLINTINTSIDTFIGNLNESNLAQRISDTLTSLVKTVKWGDLGETFSNLFNKLIRMLVKLFKNDSEGENLGSKIGTAFSKFLNKALRVDWDEAGKALGLIVNNIQSFFDKLFNKRDGIKWDKLGKKMGRFIKRAIKTIDFEAIGTTLKNMFEKALTFFANLISSIGGDTLAQAVTDFITGFLGDLNWDDIQSAINDIATELAKFLNGLLTPENLELVASTLANALTALFNGLYTFAQEVDWKKWGRAIARAINTFVKEFDWKLAGKAVNKIAKGLLDTLLEAVREINWTRIGNKLITFLSQIDWKSISLKARKISKELRMGLDEVWTKLKESGAFEDILQVIVDFLNEKSEWEKYLKKIKKSIIRAVFAEQFKDMINPLNWFDFTELEEKLKNVAEWFNRLFHVDVNTSEGSHGGGQKFDAPGYASGQVIPPSMSAHLAVLGDNNKETEVVSPLSTIKQALKEAMGEQNVNVTFQVEGDPNGIFKVVQKESVRYNQKTGVSAFA